MGPLRNDAQRRFAWVIRLSFVFKIAAMFGAIVVLKVLGVL
jgi:hypothetical protein